MTARREADVRCWRGVAAAALAVLAAAGAPAEERPACADPDDCGAWAIEVEAEQLLADVAVLAADDMEGRYPGTPGSARAREYIAQRFAEVGLTPFVEGYVHPFSYFSEENDADIHAANVLGWIDSPDSDRVIVVSAHYDHLGVVDGVVFNGADDNASGVATLLAVAQAFVAAPPRHDLVFAAFDAEEEARDGARAFLAAPPVPRDAIALNVNLDMVSQSDVDEIYAAGGHHAPWLAPWLEWIANDAAVTVLQGHDGRLPDEEQEDWTPLSDHGVFHDAGMPFVYFGVEDHPRFHQPNDDADAIPLDFFTRSTATILRAMEIFDAELDAIDAARADWEAWTGGQPDEDGRDPPHER